MNTFTQPTDTYALLLGIQVQHVTPGHYAKCSTRVTENMLNCHQTTHGGFLCSLADVTFAAAAQPENEPAVALSITGSFFKASRAGDLLVAEAQLLHASRTFRTFRIDIYREDVLIASFNGTAARLPSSADTHSSHAESQEDY